MTPSMRPAISVNPIMMSAAENVSPSRYCLSRSSRSSCSKPAAGGARVGDQRRMIGGVGAVEREPDDDAEGRERRALGEVQPLQESRAQRRTDRRCEPPVAVTFENVLDDRTGLAHHHVTVFDGRQLAERRFLHEEVARGRLKFDAFERVRQAEFFEQPDDPHRSRARRVVELDHCRVRDTSRAFCCFNVSQDSVE